MKLPIFKQSLVATLWQNVDANYDLYMEGDFSDFLALPEIQNQTRDVKGLSVRSEDFINLIAESGGVNDAHNAHIVFSAFENLTPNIANDERIWVAATHTYGLKFVRDRWLNSGRTREINLRGIKAHFFARVDGIRGLHRNNALSSLWWWAYVVHRGGEVDFAKRLTTFLSLTDLRATILERPTTTRVPQVFQAIVISVTNKLEKEPDTAFFSRKRSSNEKPPYRIWLEKINLWGGIKLYNTYSAEELSAIFSGFIDEVEEETSAH